MALSADRKTSLLHNPTDRLIGVKSGVTIYGGAMVVMEAGIAEPGRTATGLICAGVALARVAGGVADGDTAVRARTGIWDMRNSSGADAVTIAHRGLPCWVVDDETVAATDGNTGTGATRSIAGIVWDVDAQGVWVRFD